MKKKRTKKEIGEQAMRDAGNLPIVRQLRRPDARGTAELEAHRGAEQR